jgi:regulatory protein
MTKRTPEAEAAPLTPEALHGRALALLTRREHSLAELRQKLREAGGLATDIQSVLEGLVARGLQSDARFAETFLRSRIGRGYGPRVIAADLKARGLDAEAVSAALAGGGHDWAVLAAEVRRKRFGNRLPAEPRERARQLRFLQYRGFTGSQAGQALSCEVADDES